MLDIRELYLVLVVVHTLVSGTLFVYVWARRRTAGAASLAFLLCTTMVWMLGIGLTTLSISETQAQFWFTIRTIGLYVAAAGFYTKASEYTRDVTPFRGPWLAVLWGVPLVVLVGYATASPIYCHTLFFHENGLMVWRETQRGPLLLAGYGYLYGLTLTAIGRLVRHAWTAPAGERRASTWVAIGAAAPIVTSLLRQSGLISLSVGTFLMPMALTLLSCTFVLAVFRYRWLDLSPLARNLLDAVADPIFVQDDSRRFLLVNDAFARWVGLPAEQIIGRSDDDLFPIAVVERWREVDARLLRVPSRTALEQTSHDERNGVVMVTHRSLYRDVSGEPLIVGVVRDVTDFEHVRHELEAKVGELEAALVEVKRLQGILPICMYCKKIRDDSNYWQRVEEYVSARTEAVFSHGVCPDCYGRAMADYSS